MRKFCVLRAFLKKHDFDEKNFKKKHDFEEKNFYKSTILNKKFL